MWLTTRVDPSDLTVMDDTATVDQTATASLQVVSTKYPRDRVHLLKAIQAQRGDTFISETVRYALDLLVEGAFPGSTEDA